MKFEDRTAGAGLVAILSVLLFATCASKAELPVDTMLWRLDRAWAQEGDVRRATATLLSFRSSGEFVELHGWLEERADGTVYVERGRPRVAAVGKWTREDDLVTAVRDRVTPKAKSLCSEPPLKFQILATSVVGNAGGTGEGTYSPVTRLVAPDFETHLEEAKEPCRPAPQ